MGFGPRKLFNLRVLEAGLNSVKKRLALGIGSNDAKTKPLSKGYAKRKSRLLRIAAKRDMRLTGSFLDSFLPRYSDEQKASAAASGRLGRLKAIEYKADLLNFSPADMRLMSDTAKKLVVQEVVQVSEPLDLAKFSTNAKFARAVSFRRSEFFAKAA